jgi:RimJ/RimL family protein N-acetyltransferase
MEQFTTRRLLGNRLRPEDIDDLVALHLDPEVSLFLGGVRTAEASAAYLEKNLQHWAEHGFGLWAVRNAAGDFLGRAGLRYIDVEGTREIEIAYTLVRSAWGLGYASELSRALIEIWDTRLEDPSLIGIVEKGNSASERVLIKADFLYKRDVLFNNVVVGLFRRARKERF